MDPVPVVSVPVSIQAQDLVSVPVPIPDRILVVPAPAPKVQIPAKVPVPVPAKVPVTAKVPVRTLRETVTLARASLDVKNDPTPIERKVEMKEMRGYITNSLRTLQKGRKLSNIRDLNNIYVCGLPGFGKTLTVEKLLKNLMIEQTERNLKNCTGRTDELSNSTTIKKRKRMDNKIEINEKDALPQYNVVDISGTMVHADTFYQVIAERLGMNVSGFGSTIEKVAREKVLERFRSEQNYSNTLKGSGKEVFPITILMIDEIDKAPIKIIRELLEIIGNTTSTSTSTSTSSHKSSSSPPSSNQSDFYDCSLIVIGIANSLTFSYDVQVTYNATEHLQVIPFKPYEISELQSILNNRSLRSEERL